MVDSQYYSLICDDVINETSVHHLVWWVDAAFNIGLQEDFIRPYKMPAGDAEAVTGSIKGVLYRCSLSITDCRGQCCDGASVMAGAISDVKQRLRAEERRALFVALVELGNAGWARNISVFQDMFDSLKDLIIFIKQSPKKVQEFA